MTQKIILNNKFLQRVTRDDILEINTPLLQSARNGQQQLINYVQQNITTLDIMIKERDDISHSLLRSLRDLKIYNYIKTIIISHFPRNHRWLSELYNIIKGHDNIIEIIILGSKYDLKSYILYKINNLPNILILTFQTIDQNMLKILTGYLPLRTNLDFHFQKTVGKITQKSFFDYLNQMTQTQTRYKFKQFVIDYYTINRVNCTILSQFFTFNATGIKQITLPASNVSNLDIILQSLTLLPELNLVDLNNISTVYSINKFLVRSNNLSKLVFDQVSCSDFYKTLCLGLIGNTKLCVLELNDVSSPETNKMALLGQAISSTNIMDLTVSRDGFLNDLYIGDEDVLNFINSLKFTRLQHLNFNYYISDANLVKFSSELLRSRISSFDIILDQLNNNREPYRRFLYNIYRNKNLRSIKIDFIDVPEQVKYISGLLSMVRHNTHIEKYYIGCPRFSYRVGLHTDQFIQYLNELVLKILYYNDTIKVFKLPPGLILPDLVSLPHAISDKVRIVNADIKLLNILGPRIIINQSNYKMSEMSLQVRCYLALVRNGMETVDYPALIKIARKRLITLREKCQYYEVSCPELLIG